MEQKQILPADSHFKHSSFQHSPSTPAASLSLQPIAYIHSDFSEKFGIPRQSGLVNSLQAKIVFTEPFRNQDCIRGIEEFSHLWLIWGFSKNQRDKWAPTVRSAKTRRKQKKRSICQSCAFPSQPSWTILCMPGTMYPHFPGRTTALYFRCRFIRRYSNLRYQTLSCFYRFPSGGFRKLFHKSFRTPSCHPLSRGITAPYPHRKKTVSLRLPFP